MASIRCFAGEALPQIGQRVFLWVRATPLFLCRLHARRHIRYSREIAVQAELAQYDRQTGPAKT